VTRDASYWIDALALERHPEGGYYRETYRAAGTVGGRELPHGGDRRFSTAILYLLTSDDASRLHRLRSDEVFHFHVGSTLTVHVIEPAGEYRRIALGHEPRDGEVLQAVVPAGCWFGATVERRDSYALVGCTVAPGFEFADLELGRRDDLLARYPQHRAIVERLARP
jgi:predicted cupin superfamily sugar epimerase